MTISIYLAGQNVAGILSDSELDSTPQGKLSLPFTFSVLQVCSILYFLSYVLEVANRSPAW